MYDARAPRTCSFLPAFNFLLSRQELDFHLCFVASFFWCTVSLTISFQSPLWIFSLFLLVAVGRAGGLVCVFSIAVLCTTLSVAFCVFQFGRSRVVVVVVFVVVLLLVIVVLSICFRTTD